MFLYLNLKKVDTGVKGRAMYSVMKHCFAGKIPVGGLYIKLPLKEVPDKDVKMDIVKDKPQFQKYVDIVLMGGHIIGTPADLPADLQSRKKYVMDTPGVKVRFNAYKAIDVDRTVTRRQYLDSIVGITEKCRKELAVTSGLTAQDMAKMKMSLSKAIKDGYVEGELNTVDILKMNCPDFDVDDFPLFYVKNLQAHNILTKTDLSKMDDVTTAKKLMDKMCDRENLKKVNEEFRMMSAIKETMKSQNPPKVARKKKSLPAPAASAAAIKSKKSNGGSNVKRLGAARRLIPVVEKKTIVTPRSKASGKSSVRGRGGKGKVANN